MPAYELGVLTRAPVPRAVRAPEPDGDPLGSAEIRAVAMDIAFRLRTVCAMLPEGELMKLATHMAVVQHKYYRRSRT